MVLEHWSAPEFRLREADIPLWNAVISLSGQFMQIDGGKTGFTFTPLEEAPTEGVFRKLVLAKKELGYAGVSGFPFLSYCGVDLKVADLSRLPPELAAALHEGMLTTVLSALPNKIRTRIELGPEVNLGEPLRQLGAGILQWFSSTLHGVSKDPIELVFGVEPYCICKELSDFIPSKTTILPRIGNLIEIRAGHLLGVAVLTLTEISRLEPGDCILFTSIGSRDGRAILANEQVFLFEPEDAGWTCVERVPMASFFQDDRESNLEMNDTTMASPLVNDGEDQNEVLTKSLDLNISFFAGSTKLQLSEIESWQIGSVVQLPPDVNVETPQITIKANGLDVAQGSLVRIDERLAVRINRVLVSSSFEKE